MRTAHLRFGEANWSWFCYPSRPTLIEEKKTLLLPLLPCESETSCDLTVQLFMHVQILGHPSEYKQFSV